MRYLSRMRYTTGPAFVFTPGILLSGCAAGALWLAGCVDDDHRSYPPSGASCSVQAQTGCAPGLECQAVASGGTGCFCSVDKQTGCEGTPGTACQPVVGGISACLPPVTVTGKVFDLATLAPVQGARVVARDVNNGVVSGVAVSDAAGRYELAVPVAHDADGGLSSFQVSLRADAEGYLTFPQAPRVALPINLAQATGYPPTLASSATDIGLLALPSTSGMGSVSGTVRADAPRGTLIVAGGSTGIADHDGTYEVFNVPAGSVRVSGYKSGLQLGHATAVVEAGKVTEHVDLTALSKPLAVVSGKVDIVNPGAGSKTSVILAVEDTFDPAMASGEAPAGLRVGDVTGPWTIAGVPDGSYVVLAAFENDFLVRDPDTSIGGTDLVRVVASGANVDIAAGFKITGALHVVSPDGEQEVSGTPTFVWADDAGEDHYVVVVYDAYGNLVWENDAVPGVSGDKNVTVEYGGPALTPGMLYQFRATSIKNGGSPISRTEDLRGVFLYR